MEKLHFLVNLKPLVFSMTLQEPEIVSEFNPAYPQFVDLFTTENMELTKVMFTLFPLLATPETVYDELLDSFGEPSEEITGHQKRIINALRYWANTYSGDFNSRMQFGLQYLGHLISNNNSLNFLEKEWKLMPKKPQCYDYGKLEFTESPTDTSKHVFSGNWKKFNWIADLESNIIAEHFTAMEWEFFAEIDVRIFVYKTRDFIQHAAGTRVSSNLTRAIDHFNFMSSLVKTLILIQSTPEFMAQVILKFISIARVFIANVSNYAQ
jgi:hypothetical protein